MESAKTTWLSELKRAVDYKRIQPGTLIELLDSKVKRLEPDVERLYDRMLDISQWAGHKKIIRYDSPCPMLRYHNNKEDSDKDCVTCNQFILRNIEDECAKHVSARWKEPVMEPCVLQ